VNVTVDNGTNTPGPLGNRVDEIFTGMLNEGIEAQDDLAQIGRLDDLLTTTGGGIGVALQQFAAGLGLEIGEGVPEIQAAQALINHLVPQQRVPGSGATTDFDARMFIGALPRLINQPEGNQIIIETMRGLAQAKVARAEISLAYATGQTNPATGQRWTAQEALAAIYALPDPFAAFKAQEGGTTTPPPAAGGATPGRTVMPDGTIIERVGP
jgi:hypothetical protein